jgi:hypothetical protein
MLQAVPVFHKDADADFMRHALRVVHLDPNHAAAGRIAFENKPAQIFLFQLLDALSGPGKHATVVIRFGFKELTKTTLPVQPPG